MVNISSPPPVNRSTVGRRSSTKSSEVEKHTDERRAAPKPKPVLERRQHSDRRERQGSGRSLYDLRSGRDRRKNRPGNPDSPPTIDTEA